MKISISNTRNEKRIIQTETSWTKKAVGTGPEGAGSANQRNFPWITDT